MMVVVICLLTWLLPMCHGLTIFSLSPQTTPEEIVSAQLVALQKDDMQTVFDFASPGNKANVHDDVRIFDRMVRSSVYVYLLRHETAEILMTATYPNKNEQWQGLVRVLPNNIINNNSPAAEVKEYWWVLSRCKTGPHKECFMVDADMPNS